jgi:3-phenylpropionate/cinnamic acid dioxygenase small subunit
VERVRPAAPPHPVSDAERRMVVDFLYREARLADEARYGEWLALWTDDAVYWVPATTDPTASPDTRISHIYDNRARLETRVKLLQSGHRYSQEPASVMRRLISNIEVEAAEGGELVAGSNFILGELAVQAGHEMHWWVGRATHRLRQVDGELRMSRKTVVLVNAAEPLPNLSFLI